MANDLTSVNRKIHIHLGLFLLFFIWLFALSGLLLNHGGWKFTSFWEERQEVVESFQVPPSVFGQADPYLRISKHLEVSGEMQNMRATDDGIAFRIHAPGIVRDIQVSRDGRGTQKIIRFNKWGKLRTLHTFNGADKEVPEAGPNWVITRIWRFSMDVIAVSLIVICITSWIMWFRVRGDYPYGTALLVAGFLFAIYFVFLIR